MSNEQKPASTPNDASRQVSGPSIGLLITGIIGAAVSLISLISISIGTGVSSIMVEKVSERYIELYEGAVGIASSLVGILVAALVIYASLKMKEFTQWGLCVAASILAMIPCISPCCILGLPIGIWCLVVLMKPEVKAAFH